MHNDKYNFVLPFKSEYSHISFGFSTSVVKIETLSANSYYSSFISHYAKVLNSFYKPSFKKIKFRGKGYYIYKNPRNTIAPQFGYSHRLYIYSYFNKVKFIGKTTVVLFGLVKNDLIRAGLDLKSKRSMNIFTGRGVRFARQVVYKKQGKVSSYR
jgi:ribosomal protein L6P/L9E